MEKWKNATVGAAAMHVDYSGWRVAGAHVGQAFQLGRRCRNAQRVGVHSVHPSTVSTWSTMSTVHSPHAAGAAAFAQNLHHANGYSALRALSTGSRFRGSSTVRPVSAAL